jgi:hypothetical protein
VAEHDARDERQRPQWVGVGEDFDGDEAGVRIGKKTPSRLRPPRNVAHPDHSFTAKIG